MGRLNLRASPAAVKAREEYIKERFAAGESKSNIARKVGLTPQRVGQILGVTPRQPEKLAIRDQGLKPLYRNLAHQYVTIAIRYGELPKLDGSVKCSRCDSPAGEYDHRDYWKPMDVQPVCLACNQSLGAGKHKYPDDKNRPMTLKHKFELGIRGGSK